MKKKFWRCNICNDLHWGTQPPELCPTCKVKNAYVEVTPNEARVILERIVPPPDPAFTPEDFRRAIEAFAAPNEFRVHPDEARVASLIQGVFENERNHGLKFCPCRLRTKDPVEDLHLICPCNFETHDTYRDKPQGECWCGLFIRR